jgi:hypothetical protein
MFEDPDPVANVKDNAVQVVPSVLYSTARLDPLDPLAVFNIPNCKQMLLYPVVLMPDIVQLVLSVLVIKILPPPDAPVYPDDGTVVLTSALPEYV